jgi:protein TonB
MANRAKATYGATAAISGAVLNGKATSLPNPPYPPIAKAAHASGNVTVEVTIDEDGNVVSARAVSGHPLLQAASVAAARQAKFAPTKLSGQPTKVQGVLVYTFSAE